MNNNWLQSLTESYKQISIQKELETLVEHIHNEQPSLNENEIKEFLLNELKMLTPVQLKREADKSYNRAVWGSGIMGKVKQLMGRFGLANPPKGHPTPSTRYHAERGTKADDAQYASRETKDSLEKLSQMKPGDASGVVADLARGDRATELGNRIVSRQQAGVPAFDIRKGPWALSNITKVEKAARARQQLGVGPQGTATGDDMSKPIVQDKKPEEPKTKKPRQPRKSK